ncbi:hypothetical protein GLOTRDRAFT_112480 [Gloeophyllum trabeum ATCC 11539]|uniref:Uncharacterized protein n=1 Tax=Gloeophyllum trabeum (strain ATCC 11539 / FP-39264 / Madison 617) TaxID=670483 RepID=S7RAH8_GLOTA|nr:uncharacterized protein GLOTRDRAFT_112480 [Gloeophyllum trabeum ATCC 11539]EPQ51260.1 hypothetical protein GLOTRDRAFT_112480 [Gloeophyllum trabeum ATCC 11539]
MSLEYPANRSRWKLLIYALLQIWRKRWFPQAVFINIVDVQLACVLYLVLSSPAASSLTESQLGFMYGSHRT